MYAVLQHDLYKYLAVAVLLLAILFAWLKGRGAVSASGRSLAWTNVPLMAFAIISLGPSALAILIYVGYKSGLIQPDRFGYHFSTYITDLPFDFAVMNWAFVALYVACRLRPNVEPARAAMWFSVVMMSFPNILLFVLAPTMVSSVYDAGQGIGIVQAMLMLPIIAMILPGPLAGIYDAGLGLGFVVAALTGPIPLLGLIGWLLGRGLGRADARREARMRS